MLTNEIEDAGDMKAQEKNTSFLPISHWDITSQVLVRDTQKKDSQSQSRKAQRDLITNQRQKPIWKSQLSLKALKDRIKLA